MGQPIPTDPTRNTNPFSGELSRTGDWPSRPALTIDSAENDRLLDIFEITESTIRAVNTSHISGMQAWHRHRIDPQLPERPDRYDLWRALNRQDDLLDALMRFTEQRLFEYNRLQTTLRTAMDDEDERQQDFRPAPLSPDDPLRSQEALSEASDDH